MKHPSSPEVQVATSPSPPFTYRYQFYPFNLNASLYVLEMGDFLYTLNCGAAANNMEMYNLLKGNNIYEIIVNF